MSPSRRIYVIGSLRNPEVQEVSNRLRRLGHDVFDDWQAAGPEADDYWQAYERARGHTYLEALTGRAARHVYGFDKEWLMWADTVVLVLPAGKSGHLEFGWAVGQGKEGYILLNGEPERYDVMYQFATCVSETLEDLMEVLDGQPEEVRTASAVCSCGGGECICGRQRSEPALLPDYHHAPDCYCYIYRKLRAEQGVTSAVLTG